LRTTFGRASVLPIILRSADNAAYPQFNERAAGDIASQPDLFATMNTRSLKSCLLNAVLVSLALLRRIATMAPGRSHPSRWSPRPPSIFAVLPRCSYSLP
jgi:hypothetical protein